VQGSTGASFEGAIGDLSSVPLCIRSVAVQSTRLQVLRDVGSVVFVGALAGTGGLDRPIAYVMLA
jgi:hypothetical protein